jgi:hypothetical protein
MWRSRRGNATRWTAYVAEVATGRGHSSSSSRGHIPARYQVSLCCGCGPRTASTTAYAGLLRTNCIPSKTLSARMSNRFLIQADQ